MSTASATATSITMVTPGLLARLVGLGSVFGKTFRDSRRTAVLLGLVTALILLVTSASVAGEFNTIEKRLGIAAQMAALPEIFQGMLGRMINIERIGGFLSWRTINFLPIILGIWTIVAMSGLLAGELARVVRLPAGRGIERGAVQIDAQSVRRHLRDARVERAEVRVVVVESLGHDGREYSVPGLRFHSRHPSLVTQSR